MRRSIPQVNAEIIDFAALAQAPDQAIIERFGLLNRLSSKPVFDRRLKFNSCQVGREPQRLTVRFLQAEPGKEPKLIAQCCFVPPSSATPKPVRF